MLKVLAFNASPHIEKSNTTLVLDPFLGGLEEEGASIETFYTSQLNQPLPRRPKLLDKDSWQMHTKRRRGNAFAKNPASRHPSVRISTLR